jgi:NAD(P)-dependent dehydrogenase (short-subunit alcohol dehydrogenase family)
MKLKGKTAFVTGSSRGIGQQIAFGLASLGCNIITHGRTEESCTETLAALKEYEINTFHVFGELSEESGVQSIISQVESLHVPVDILYNNAAIMKEFNHDIWSYSWDDWISTYKVNVVAMYHLCSHFIPKMIANDFGRVINLRSNIHSEPGLAPYGASKWAVDKLTNDLAAGISNTNVRVNTLDPGWIKTDMGGENADHPVTAVLPGALQPSLIDNDGPNGEAYLAIDQRWK